MSFRQRAALAVLPQLISRSRNAWERYLKKNQSYEETEIAKREMEIAEKAVQLFIPNHYADQS